MKQKHLLFCSALFLVQLTDALASDTSSTDVLISKDVSAQSREEAMAELTKAFDLKKISTKLLAERKIVEIASNPLADDNPFLKGTETLLAKVESESDTKISQEDPKANDLPATTGPEGNTSQVSRIPISNT